MNIIIEAINYVLNNSHKFYLELNIHLLLSLISLILAFIISFPAGILCARNENFSNIIMNLTGALRVIPALAIIIIIIPFVGTGFMPALIALTILAVPPILINTALGINSTDNNLVEAALGMGMDSKQLLLKIELPNALPFILSGIKTATVEVISSATLGAFIGAGGLGTFIITGLAMYNFSLLLVGAAPVTILALSAELLFNVLEKIILKHRKQEYYENII